MIKVIVKYSLLDSNDAARVRLKTFELFTQYISSLQLHHQDTQIICSVEVLKVLKYFNTFNTSI